MTQPLHIAIERDLYKKSKANILASEIAILNSMKHLHAIRQTQLQQQELRKRVFEAFDFIRQRTDRLAARKLPEIKEIPKAGYRKEQITIGTKMPVEKKKEIKANTNQKKSIEEELESIQKKLEMLNQ